MRLSIRQYATGLLELEQELGAKHMKEIGENFFGWLTRRGEEKKINQIVKEAERIVKEREGVADVVITTAHETDTTTKEALRRQAGAVFVGKSVGAHFVTDASLIGGARMKSDEVLYDGSIAGRMKKLKKVLVK